MTMGGNTDEGGRGLRRGLSQMPWTCSLIFPPRRPGEVLWLFFSWGSWGTEQLSNVPKVMLWRWQGEFSVGDSIRGVGPGAFPLKHRTMYFSERSSKGPQIQPYLGTRHEEATRTPLAPTESYWRLHEAMRSPTIAFQASSIRPWGSL